MVLSSKIRAVTALLVNISRLLLAAVLLVSGFVKAVDPMGLSYKLGDYAAAFGVVGIDDEWLLFAATMLSAGDVDVPTQMKALAALTAELDARGCDVELVADEWCNTLEDIKLFADNKAGHMVQIKTPDLGGINNTIEAVLYCKEKGIGAYQGGTCNETDRSAQVCVHCAMATQPVQILAKPGMGVDEGYMIVYNEMNRIMAIRAAKKNAGK